ncbi:MAG: peroxiredoxin-like family protein [Planctomycetota bacterium]
MIRFMLLVCLSLPVLAAVPEDASATQALRVGQPVPSVTLQDAAGESHDLSQLVQEAPSVLVFYRGSWCPFCQRHLQELAAALPDIRQHGYQVLTISPDLPEHAASLAAEQGLDYRLLSDADGVAMRAFGLAFQVDAATRERYQGSGIDLEAASGQDHHQLPVPAVFLVGSDGVIDFVHADPDYRQRFPTAALLAMIEAQAESMVEK